MNTSERRASFLSKDWRSATSALWYQSGSWYCASAAERKSSNAPGTSQNTRHNPPVRPAAQYSPRSSRLRSTSWAKMTFSPQMPMSGNVSPGMTKAMDTVRNLLYMGR